MLVITRKPGESIMIGENVRVVVVSVRGGKSVRLGIEADSDTLILREEVYDQASLPPREPTEKVAYNSLN